MRVLIVGLGSIAKKHIAALKTINPDVEILALRNSLDSEPYEDIINVFDIDEIQGLKISFAIVSNPTSLHQSTIESLIPLQIPLFIEKPIFDSLNNKDILEKIHKEGIYTYVACNLRFLESLQFAKEYIDRKRINEVNIYCGSYLPDWRPGQDFKKVYSANKEMGGGVHIDLIHELDYAYWFFNKPSEVIKNVSNGSSLEISAIDYANYLLKYDTFNVSIILNYYRRDPKRNFEIICEDGTLYVDILKNSVYWNNNLIFNSRKGILDTYLDQLRFFIDNILTKKASFNDINEAYEILELCLAND